MNGLVETKSEIRARIDELMAILGVIEHADGTMSGVGNDVPIHVERRMKELKKALDAAEEDLSSSIIRSHKAICEVKQMGEKEAYGNDPAMYYTLGICGEAGEMANAIVKARRNGEDQAKVLEAVKSELPDVIVYSFVLAHVLDIDLSKLANDKVEIVIQRARDGYYGKPLRVTVSPASRRVLDPVEIVKELPVDKHRLCLTQEGKRVCLELWFKTRRRKSPWDRLAIASMEDGAGLVVEEFVNERAHPFLERIRELIPEFDPLAVVLAVSSR